MWIQRKGKIKEIYSNNKLKFEGKHLNGKIWNVKGYNSEGKEKYEIKEGKGFVIIYGYKGELIFEGEYLNGEKKKEKNIMIKVN